MTKILNTDVAIIGAGPAGSTAAHRLSQQGIKTILIDKEAFPRNKTCGDGVTSEGLEVLKRTGLENWIEEQFPPDLLRLTSPGGTILDITPPNQLSYCYGRVIPRNILDHKLVESAVGAGCTLMEKTRAELITWDADVKPVIETSNGSIHAEAAILAEGSHNSLGRRSGLSLPEADMVAIRQYFQGNGIEQGTMEIHFSKKIIPGYSWIFPANNGLLNIGTGTYIDRIQKQNMTLQDALTGFVNWHQQKFSRLGGLKAVGKPQGQTLVTGFQPRFAVFNRLLVAGESAGLVSPLTGEGIAAALLSGEMAADTLTRAFERKDFSQQTLMHYRRTLKDHFLKDWQAARFIRLILDMPGLINRAITRMLKDDDMALTFAFVVLGHYSPAVLLKPKNLLRLMF